MNVASAQNPAITEAALFRQFGGSRRKRRRFHHQGSETRGGGSSRRSVSKVCLLMGRSPQSGFRRQLIIRKQEKSAEGTEDTERLSRAKAPHSRLNEALHS